MKHCVEHVFDVPVHGSAVLRVGAKLLNLVTIIMMAYITVKYKMLD